MKILLPKSYDSSFLYIMAHKYDFSSHTMGPARGWNHSTIASSIANSLFFRDIFMLCVSFCHTQCVVMSIFMTPAIGSGS